MRMELTRSLFPASGRGHAESTEIIWIEGIFNGELKEQDDFASNNYADIGAFGISFNFIEFWEIL